MNTTKITLLSMGFIVAAGFVLTTGGCKKSDPKTQARNEIQKLYDDQNTALKAKNVDGFFAHHAPDYTTISVRGKTQDLTAERKDITLLFTDSPITNNQFVTTIHTVALEGIGGTMATVTEARLATGNVSAAGKTGQLAMTMEARDYWVKDASGWQIKRQKILSMHATMDGKPLGRH